MIKFTRFYALALFVLGIAGAPLAKEPKGKDTGYVIKVKITGVKDSMILLANYYADKQYLRDSAFLDKQGFYVFKGTKKLDQGMYTVAGQARIKYFDFIVDETQQINIVTDTADFNMHMKITGSVENDIFYEYLKHMQAQYEKMMPLQEAYNRNKTTNKDSAAIYKTQMSVIDSTVQDYKKNFIARYPKALFPKVLLMMQEVDVPEAPKLPNGQIDSTFGYRYYKAHYWDKVDLADDRLLRTPLFNDKFKRFFDNVVIQQPDTVFKEAVKMIDRTNGNKEMFKYLVVTITNRCETSDIMGMDAGFVHMVNKYYRTNQAYWVDTASLVRIIKRADDLTPIMLGKIAPPLNSYDSTLTRPIPLYGVKAKYTVVVFWDPGCGHCQKEMPKLVTAHKKMLADKMDVQVYSVCATSQVEEWKKYIRDNKHTSFINVVDHDLSRRQYDVTSTPVFFILDENKKIIAKRLVSEQIEDFLKRHSTLNGKQQIVQLQQMEE